MNGPEWVASGEKKITMRMLTIHSMISMYSIPRTPIRITWTNSNLFRWKSRQFEMECVTERQRTNIYCSVAASTKCWNRPSTTDIRNSWYHHSLQQRNEMDRFAHASVICAFPLETIWGFLLPFFCFIWFPRFRYQRIATKNNWSSSRGTWSVIQRNLYNSWPGVLNTSELHCFCV